MRFSKTSLRTEDSDQFRAWEAESGVDAQRVQLSRGRGVYQADFAQVGEVSVWRYREPQRILTEYALQPGCVELCFARCPDTPVWCGLKLPTSAVVIHLPGKNYRTILPSGSQTYGVVLTESSIRRNGLIPAELLQRADSHALASAFSPEGRINRVLSLLDRLIDRGDEAPQIAHDSAITSCLDAVEECFPDRSRLSTLPNKQVVDDAIDLIASRLRDEMQINDMLQPLDVSRRILERAFKLHLGVSPLQYLLARRLELARRMLKRDEASVLETCLSCGFNHPSRFAEMYFRQFGELPSQTAKRRA